MKNRPFHAVDRNWLLRQGVGLLLAGVLLLAIFENTRLDLMLSEHFFDTQIMAFPLQQHWFFSDFLHHGLKSAFLALGFVAVAVALYGVRGGLAWLPPRQAWLAGLGTVLIPLLTAGLKHLTNRHCPWDIVDFGGYAPYVSLFANTPPDIVRGVCFPAGHASAGFVWLAWVPALRRAHPPLARLTLAFGLCTGLLMGVGRLAQGAHFLSHVLWSAWFAWALTLALAAVLRVPVTPALQTVANDARPGELQRA